jgi:peptidyl-prolyl cis-trans isomerase SurA
MAKTSAVLQRPSNKIASTIPVSYAPLVIFATAFFKTYSSVMKLLYSAILFFSIIAVSGQPAPKGNKKSAKSIPLFTVNGQPVGGEEFIYIYKKNNQGKTDSYTEAKIQEYLDLFINFKLKVAEARSLGIDTSASFQKEFKSYHEELKKPYQAEGDELERLTKETYQRLTEEVKASHILVAIPDATDTIAAYNKIVELKKRISAGEDFEKLARERSEDPSAKSNGGSLGYFTAMQMVFPFENAVYHLKVGEVSGIIKTRFGYHVIKLVDRKPARGEIEISHILLRADQGDQAKTKNKIFEIYDQLKAGRNWEEVCKENSQDVSTKDSGGKLKPFGVGAIASFPEFEAVAFSLQQPKEISDPFQSSFGWHIIRLERKIPLPSYEELQPSLKRRVARDERLQISKAAVLAKRKKEFGFAETKLKEKIMALADSTLLKGKWKFKDGEEIRKGTLFTIQSNPVTAGEFITFAEKNQTPSTSDPKTVMSQLYDKFTDEKIGEVEDMKLLAENPEYRNLLNEYREGILFFNVMEKRVWNKASEDTLGQRNFYEKNKTKYSASDRVEARIFATTDKSFLEQMKTKIAKGDTLTKEDLKKFKSVQNFRPYEKGDSKAVDKVSWSVGLHEAEDNGIYYLVEIDRLILPGIKTLSEARASVISDFQDQLEKDWINELKKKYPVVMNKKNKKTVFSELEKNAASK